MLLNVSDILMQEDIEDTKGVIRICISKKSRQHNGKKKIHKGTKNDIQNMHLKPKIEYHDLHYKPQCNVVLF